MNTTSTWKKEFVNSLHNDFYLIPFLICSVVGAASLILIFIKLFRKYKKIMQKPEVKPADYDVCDTVTIELDSTDNIKKCEKSSENPNYYDTPENLPAVRKSTQRRESLANRLSRYIAKAYPSKFINRKLPEIPVAVSNTSNYGIKSEEIPERESRRTLDKGPQKLPIVIKPSCIYSSMKEKPCNVQRNTPSGYVPMNIHFKDLPKIHPKPYMTIRPTIQYLKN